MFCREQVAEFRDIEPEIKKHGAQLVVVGNGKPQHIASFRKTVGFEGELVTDPSLESYKAALFVRTGLISLFRLSVIAAGLRALRKGFRQGWTQGEDSQQGGVIVVRPPGDVLYRFASRFAGDHPEPRAALAALGPLG
jgi:hypothetical protein